MSEIAAVVVCRQLIDIHAHAVRDVEYLGSEFHFLRFTDLKRSGKGCIELPQSRAGNAADSDISKCTDRRQRKGRRVEVIANRLVPVRVQHQLIHPLLADAI